MNNKRKRFVIIAMLVIIVITGLWLAYCNLVSPTKVALVNFQKFQTTSFIKSNTDKFVHIEEVSVEELHKLKKYDAVLVFGMGIRITAEQRTQIQTAADRKIAVYTVAATNPENNICNIDSVQLAPIKEYMGNGNKKNYANLFHYIRSAIDKKKFFVTKEEAPVETASNVLYYLDENKSFETVAELESYLKSEKIYREGAPKVAIVGGMNDPFSGNREHLDSLILSLQHSGLNVYPVSSAMKRLEFLQEINPNAVIYMPHGRVAMGKSDAAVEWLTQHNIPMFAALTILQPVDVWTNDPMGLFGGFMSQSVVMPELDGAIYPYVINAQYVDENGLYLFKTIPDRLKSFTQIVNNFISLKHKPNAEKRVAIYFFKGVGQQTLTSQGLETVPALYNLLLRLKAEGYKIAHLPANVADFEKLLMAQGAVLGPYAEGAFDEFLKTGRPALVEKSEYEAWAKQSLSSESYTDVVAHYGNAPGSYMRVDKNGKSYLAVARIDLGNVVLLPQPMAGLGNDAFKIVHGTKSAPPHTYIASYLWTQHGFKADAMLHFGTHGSLEFTPQKQVALSSNDWPDRLVGTVPHFYYYTIANVGESMMAKRRAYASLVSYLTPPFMESNTRKQFNALEEKIREYYKAPENAQEKASLEVKKLTLQLGLYRDLRLDSVAAKPYSAAEIEQIENFAEEIANEKMGGQLYTTGVPYAKERIHSSVMAMSAEPIAYSLAALDKQRKKISEKQWKSKPFFTEHYLNPSKQLIDQILQGKKVDNAMICHLADISEKNLTEARESTKPKKNSMDAMVANMQNNDSLKNMPKEMVEAVKKGKHPSWIPKIGKKPKSMPANMPKSSAQDERSKEQRLFDGAILEVERTLANVVNYQTYLQQSPQLELNAIVNALNGGYTPPSSGGDAVANPSALPTGRNLYSINAEATPSEAAWDKGVSLVNATLEQYRKQHGTYPRKVSYTFWSSEFIESEGATIAQALYMLGVEPVRDAFGRVSDLQLIPSETLERPRIDVVVQTSGQFRDLAASRLALISRAVEMAAASGSDKFGNYVAESTVETERQLVEQGVSPKEAREMSTTRVFGGTNGNYGTGITGMVESGDRWEQESEIAETYLNNMGAVYGSEKNWGNFRAGLLRAVLHNTDVIVQPRQSNTWGALSLDHVYEFMGGMNLTVRNVTGKDPEAYFADYRNRNNVRMQDLKEAVGVEARTTLFNPEYIKEQMKGGASGAGQFSEVVKNTYGWNVMKPAAIDNEMWDKIYDIYVKDEFKLNVSQFFKNKNPASLEEITGVMMETARKGLWKATPEQLKNIAELHTDLVKEFGTSGSGFTSNNVKLQDFIAQQVVAPKAAEYKQQIQKMRVSETKAQSNGKSTVMKKSEIDPLADSDKNMLNGSLVVAVVLILFAGLAIIIKKRRSKA